jgi:hypothetical protein
MRTVIGIFGIIAGIALGVYVGLWVCFVGGIIGLIEAVSLLVKNGVINASLIAWSIVKIMCAGLSGYISAFLVIFPSWALLSNSYPKKRKRR